MELDKQYFAARREAIAWLKGRRDFQPGLDILSRSRYKPHMAAKIARWGETVHAKEKLQHELRGMILLWAAPDDPRHEDEEPDHHIPPTASDREIQLFIQQVSPTSPTPAALREDRPPRHGATAPTDALKEGRLRVAELFRKRGVLRNKLLGLGEKNDPDTIGRRKELIEQIQECSREIDRIYREATSPTSALCEDRPPRLGATTPTTPTDLEDMQRLRAGIRSKICKTRNRLDYGRDAKLPEPNPLPPGALRSRYEAKLLRLQAELEDIEQAISGQH